MAGFSRVKSIHGVGDPFCPDRQIAASATIVAGDLLKMTNGKAAAVAATDSAIYLATEGAVATSTSLTSIAVIRVKDQVLKVNHTPLVSGVAAASNATATVVKCALADGSSSDMVGGLVHCPELNETRIITANTYAANVVTITVAEPFSRAVTTGDTVRATAFGFGTTALKGDASTPQNLISSARADITGGKFEIFDIVTSGPKALKEVHVICT